MKHPVVIVNHTKYWCQLLFIHTYTYIHMTVYREISSREEMCKLYIFTGCSNVITTVHHK